jgi:hypothetical protein
LANLGLMMGCWLAFFLFYWWLVSKLQAQQLVAAALAGLGAALAVLALREAAALRFQIQARWLGLLLWRLPGKVLRDLGLLVAELGRSLLQRRHTTGAFKQVPFDPGQDDPQSAARRALVLAGISLPPNTVAVAVERQKHAVLVHQLVSRSETPTDREWPV